MSTEMNQVIESNSARKRRLAKEFNAARTPTNGKFIGTLSRTERDELNALSKEVFAASSRWQKLVNKGYPKLLTEEVTELVPGEKEGDEATERKVRIPLKRHDGAMQSTTEYHTVESVKSFMIERKAMIDGFKAQLKKQQEDAQAKKEQEALELKVHNELQGSAL